MATDEHFIEHDRQAIGRQISLPLTKAFEIAWKGIMIRLWRSMITMSGIVLAIAFLTTIWVTSVLISSLMAIPEGERDRLLADSVLQRQAIATESVAVQIGVITPEGTGQAAQARQEAEALANLLKPASEFQSMVVPVNADEFVANTALYDALILTGLPPDFATAGVIGELVQWVRNGGTLVIYGWDGMFPEDTPAQVREMLRAVLPGRPTDETVRMTADEVDVEVHQTTQGTSFKEIPARRLRVFQPRSAEYVVVRSGQTPFLMVTDAQKGNVAVITDDDPLDRPMLEWLRTSDLVGGIIRWGAADVLRSSSGSTRSMWLVILSLLVCIVGITNAMLMSVTERFREIGTMKCLGALDVFIVKLFLIESTVMGMVGTFLGIIIGFALAFGRATFSFTVVDPVSKETIYLGLKYMPYGAVMLRLLMAFGVGVLLSVLAAIYPAYTAARMEPVEAMRVEE